MTKFLKNADVTGYISQTSVTSSLVKTDADGKLVAAVAGTDYNAPNVTSVAGTLIREIRNTTGATLTKGTIVYISGATGNKPTVSKALATGDSTSAQTFGMCQTNISNNSNGNVVVIGDITGLDTSAFTEGAQLYLSSTTAGTYTTTKQLAPAHLVYIGVVTRSHPTQGQIEVKIQNGYELDEIHDVAISSLANNQGLFYESATDLWKNKTIATVLGYTPADDAAVVKLTGNQTVAGVKTFTSALLANNPSGGATGEGLVVGQSFKIDGSGTSQRAVMYVVSNVLSDTYGSGLQAQYANLADDKAFGFNLNASGGFELYVKNTSFLKALTIANTKAATFTDTVTATSFIKTSGTSAQFLKADGSVDSTAYTTNVGTVTSVAALTLGTTGTDLSSTIATGTTTPVITLNVPTASAANRGALSAADWTTFNSKQAALGGTGFVKSTAGVISYDTSTYLTTASAAATYQTILTNPITGSLTSGRIPKATGSNTLGNGLLYDDGSSIGLGANPAAWAAGTEGVFQTKNASLYGYSNYEAGLVANAYYSTNWYRIASPAASMIILNSNITFRVTGTGTAGSVITWLDAFNITNTGKGEFNNVVTSRNATTSASLALPTFMGAGEFMSTGASAGLFWENRSGGVTTNSNWYGWYTSTNVIRLFNGASDILQINGSNGSTRIYGNLAVGRDAAAPFDVYAGTGGALALMQNTQSTGYSGIDFFRQDNVHAGSVWVANDSAGATNNRNALTIAARNSGERVIIVGGGFDPTVTGGFEVQGSNTRLQGLNPYHRVNATSGSYAYIWLNNTTGGTTRNAYFIQNTFNDTANGVVAGSAYLYFEGPQNMEFVWAGTSRVQFTSAGAANFASSLTTGSTINSGDNITLVGELYLGGTSSNRKVRVYSTGAEGSATLNYAFWNGSAWSIVSTLSSAGAVTFNSNATISNAYIGIISAYGGDYASFSHVNRSTGANYSFLSGNGGETYVNAATSQNIYFRINNGDKMTLSDSGYLGINITAPLAPLHIQTISLSYGQIRITSTSESTGEASINYGRTNQTIDNRWTVGQGVASIGDSFGFYSGGTVRFQIATNGPATFTGSVTSNDQFRVLASGNYRINNNANGLLGYFIRSGTWKGNAENHLALATDGPYGISFYTNGTGAERIHITSAGNVIVNNGTTDNGAQFQVGGGGTFSGSVAVNGSANVTNATGSISFYGAINGITSNIKFNETTASGWGTIGSVSGYATYLSMDTASRGWIFRYVTDSSFNGTNVAAIQNDTGAITTGASYVGRATHAQLNVCQGQGGATTYRDIDLRGSWSGGEGHAITAIYGSSATNIVGQMVFQHDGPGSRMRFGRLYHGADSSTYTMELVSTSATAANLTVLGSITATSFFESSDATIKTLITDNYQAKGIESVLAKLYTKNGKEELGYFAQDVKGILPSAVNKGEDGYLNLSYREVHTAKIARLEKRVAELEQKLNLN
jgi:hypothetical protein